MKKKIIVLVLMVTLVLCGCNRTSLKSLESTPEKSKQTIEIGEYELSIARIHSKELTGKDLNTIRQKYRIVIQDNGSARVLFANKWYTALYDDVYLSISNNNGKLYNLRYEYSNNQLSILHKSDIYTFVKK